VVREALLPLGPGGPEPSARWSVKGPLPPARGPVAPKPGQGAPAPGRARLSGFPTRVLRRRERSAARPAERFEVPLPAVRPPARQERNLGVALVHGWPLACPIDPEGGGFRAL